MSYCGSSHPTLPGHSCRQSPGNHEEHFDRDEVWENTEFNRGLVPDNMSRPDFKGRAQAIKDNTEPNTRLGKLPVDWAHPPAQRHSQTSMDAADAIAPHTGTLLAAVESLIRSVGELGLTDEEMQLSLDMNPSTQRPRRIELVRAGRVAKSGRTRTTKAGRAATVWVATSP